MTPHPTIHFICGPVGAGKTTLAKVLSRDHRAPHLAIDDWMIALYGPDITQPLDWNWIGARAERCEDLMLTTALELARAGVSTVLDLGMQRRETRHRLAIRAHAAGVARRLHVLDLDPAMRWRRVEARNAEHGGKPGLQVSRPMFDFIERLWQKPTAEECAAFERP